jgi:hypothetical protein
MKWHARENVAPVNPIGTLVTGDSNTMHPAVPPNIDNVVPDVCAAVNVIVVNAPPL